MVVPRVSCFFLHVCCNIFCEVLRGSRQLVCLFIHFHMFIFNPKTTRVMIPQLFCTYGWQGGGTWSNLVQAFCVELWNEQVAPNRWNLWKPPKDICGKHHCSVLENVFFRYNIYMCVCDWWLFCGLLSCSNRITYTPIDDSCFTYYGVVTDDLDIYPGWI